MCSRYCRGDQGISASCGGHGWVAWRHMYLSGDPMKRIPCSVSKELRSLLHESRLELTRTLGVLMKLGTYSAARTALLILQQPTYTTTPLRSLRQFTRARELLSSANSRLQKVAKNPSSRHMCAMLGLFLYVLFF